MTPEEIKQRKAQSNLRYRAKKKRNKKKEELKAERLKADEQFHENFLYYRRKFDLRKIV